MLGCLLSWPFWVMHALGCIIDNQRGATLSSSIDPANGIDTSEMANFLNMFAAVVYLQNGGLVTMVDVLNKSYQLCDPMNECTPSFAPQMNAFAISLTVKSGIAVLIMLLYFSPVLPDNVLRLSFQATGLSSWFYERGATHVLE